METDSIGILALFKRSASHSSTLVSLETGSRVIGEQLPTATKASTNTATLAKIQSFLFPRCNIAASVAGTNQSASSESLPNERQKHTVRRTPRPEISCGVYPNRIGIVHGPKHVVDRSPNVVSASDHDVVEVSVNLISRVLLYFCTNLYTGWTHREERFTTSARQGHACVSAPLTQLGMIKIAYSSIVPQATLLLIQTNS